MVESLQGDRKNHWALTLKEPVPEVFKLDSPEGEATGLLTLERNIVLYENEKLTETDNQPAIDPDPGASLVALWLGL